MQTNTKLLTGILAVFLLSVAAGSSATHSYNDTRTGLVPGTVLVPGVIEAGLATCEFVSGTGPTACDTGGLGVFFIFGPGDAPHTDTADATCTVTKNEGSHGDVAATCAVDRDDDDWVTNSATIDAADDDTDGVDHRSGTEYNPGEGDILDDAFFGFTIPNGQFSNTATGCLAHDTATNVDGIADHEWDDVVVFLGNVAGGVPYAGTASVELTLTDRSTDC